MFGIRFTVNRNGAFGLVVTNTREDQRPAKPSTERDMWLRAVAGGVLVGNATAEPGVGAVERYRTHLTPPTPTASPSTTTGTVSGSD